ncbi:MAG: hypothetical protein QXL57_02540 [Candidatus Bathyarchaeia archaeon]
MVETMSVNEKILKTLKNAKSYLEKSMTALNNKNDTLFSDSLWHFAAELEYALFLFSIILRSENNGANWKPNPKKIDVIPNRREVQTLLNEAERFVADGKLLEAYKNVYVIRHYTLKIQEDLAKKKLEAIKKK